VVPAVQCNRGVCGGGGNWTQPTFHPPFAASVVADGRVRARHSAESEAAFLHSVRARQAPLIIQILAIRDRNSFHLAPSVCVNEGDWDQTEFVSLAAPLSPGACWVATSATTAAQIIGGRRGDAWTTRKHNLMAVLAAGERAGWLGRGWAWQPRWWRVRTVPRHAKHTPATTQRGGCVHVERRRTGRGRRLRGQPTNVRRVVCWCCCTAGMSATAGCSWCGGCTQQSRCRRSCRRLAPTGASRAARCAWRAAGSACVRCEGGKATAQPCTQAGAA
jgi:hypothetical protein